MVLMISEDEVYNGWKVIEELGAGAYGEVHKVRHVESGDVAAMKCMESKDAIVEVNALKALQYCGYMPARLDNFAIDSTYSALVMTLGESDLFTLRQNNATGETCTFESRTVKAIAFHLISAMEFIHQKNWIHRDLKEGNVVVKINSHLMSSQPLMLIDWGIAVQLDNPALQVAKPPFGQSTYSSPHMILDPASKRDDLTMIMYLLLLERGYDWFADLHTSHKKRSDFEKVPEAFVSHESDKWIVQLAKKIFEKPHYIEPDYKGMLSVIKKAENGYEPEKFIFQLKENNGKKFLL